MMIKYAGIINQNVLCCINVLHHCSGDRIKAKLLVLKLFADWMKRFLNTLSPLTIGDTDKDYYRKVHSSRTKQLWFIDLSKVCDKNLIRFQCKKSDQKV